MPSTFPDYSYANGYSLVHLMMIYPSPFAPRLRVLCDQERVRKGSRTTYRSLWTRTTENMTIEKTNPERQQPPALAVIRRARR